VLDEWRRRSAEEAEGRGRIGQRSEEKEGKPEPNTSVDPGERPIGVRIKVMVAELMAVVPDEDAVSRSLLIELVPPDKRLAVEPHASAEARAGAEERIGAPRVDAVRDYRVSGVPMPEPVVEIICPYRPSGT